jgi:two-component system sensor histidine kinase AlgZ
MHPLLSHPARLAGYLVWAAAFGVAIAVLMAAVAPGDFASALLFTVPLTLVYAFQCLSVWYPVRRLAEAGVRAAASAVVGATLAALVSALVWCGLGWLWARALVELGRPEALIARANAVLPLLAVLGVLLFALAVLAHLVLAVLERSRAAERRALELQVLARDAELKSLKAQLDPHFLFNSLNSVAALIGTDAPAARRMCFLMAGFFRKSLGLGRRQSIPLAEEIYLAETFLAIEEVRFGERLRARFEVEETALALEVPPLVLQPLVENAVHHGVAHLVEGGEVRVAARRRDDLLELAVENPCDPERPASRGAGVGLANVGARLEALFGHRARLTIDAAPERYRVSLLLPAQASGSGAG